MREPLRAVRKKKKGVVSSEISVDASEAAGSSELDGVFTFKKRTKAFYFTPDWFWQEFSRTPQRVPAHHGAARCS